MNNSTEIEELNTLLTDVHQPLTSVNNNVSIVYQNMHLLNGQWFGCVMISVATQLFGWVQLVTGLKTIPSNASYSVFAGGNHFQRHYAGFIQTDSGGIPSGTYMIIIPC